jgi:hypothetical protein
MAIRVYESIKLPTRNLAHPDLVVSKGVEQIVSASPTLPFFARLSDEGLNNSSRGAFQKLINTIPTHDEIPLSRGLFSVLLGERTTRHGIKNGTRFEDPKEGFGKNFGAKRLADENRP